MVSCLIPVLVTEELWSTYSATCSVCGRALELSTTAILDRKAKIVVHRMLRIHEQGCLAQYIIQVIRDNPDWTTMQLMMYFGLARRQIDRYRVKAKKITE